MPTAQKADTIVEIKEKFSGSSAVVLTDYRGLTVKEMQQLRSKLRETGAEVRVFKNTLTEIALKELDFPAMNEYLAGPTAFVFVSGDPVAPAKALLDFAKVHKALEFKGGLMDGQVIAAEGVKRIASLPSREQLVAQFMGALISPIRGFMYVANGPTAAFARAVRAVADQKSAA